MTVLWGAIGLELKVVFVVLQWGDFFRGLGHEDVYQSIEDYRLKETSAEEVGTLTLNLYIFIGKS